MCVFLSLITNLVHLNDFYNKSLVITFPAVSGYFSPALFCLLSVLLLSVFVTFYFMAVVQG